MPTKTITPDEIFKPALTAEMIHELFMMHAVPIRDILTKQIKMLDIGFAHAIEQCVIDCIRERMAVRAGQPGQNHIVALIANPKNGTPIMATRGMKHVDTWQTGGENINGSKIKKHLPIELKGIFDEEEN